MYIWTDEFPNLNLILKLFFVVKVLRVFLIARIYNWFLGAYFRPEIFQIPDRKSAEKNGDKNNFQLFFQFCFAVTKRGVGAI
jgi:hypothetical protein